MDAKAKVEVFKCPKCGAPAARHQSETYNGDVLTAYVYSPDDAALTDHEAALAELESENLRLKVENQLKTRTADRWVPCPDHRDKTNDQGCYMCQLERANKRHTTLLTDLEALAGEWEKKVRSQLGYGPSGGSTLLCAGELKERIRTLTNSAKGLTNEDH